MIENLVGKSRIVTTITYAINYYFFGLSLSSFRYLNFFIHFLNTLLMGWLFYRWTKKIPFLAMSLFLLAPITVESVIYLTGRSGLLSTFFVLLALAMQGSVFLEKKPLLRIFTFCLTMGLAVLSKENAVAILLLVFLVQPFDKKRYIESFPLISSILIAFSFILFSKWSYITNSVMGIFRIHGELYALSYDQFLLLQLSLWPKMFALLFNPSLMSIDHSVVLPSSIFSINVALGFSLLVFGIFCIYQSFKKMQFAYLSIAWFFICLLPTNSIIPVFDPLAERHLYMASIGIAWFISYFIMNTPYLKNVWLVFFVLSFSLVPIAKSRAQDWRSAYSLWSDAYEKYPSKYRIALNTAYYASLELEDRRPAIKIACKLLNETPPGDLTYEQQELLLSFIKGNLGIVMNNLNSKTSINDIDKYCLLNGFWKDLFKLKLTLPWQEKDEWLDQYEKTYNEYSSKEPINLRASLSYYAHTLEVYLGFFYVRLEDWQNARLQFEKVLFNYKDRHSPYWQIRENLGDAYRKLGLYEKAAEQYELCMYQYKVFKRFPKSLLEKMIENYKQLNDLVRAKDSLGEMIRVYTDDPRVRDAYATALEELNDRHAGSQRKEANFYLRNARNLEEYEIISP
ncbi:MAG: hypothetical protein M9962_00975 [Oligoflexia bacterium]|nr:hypothetical protein [Oligoflexia bacterium]